MFTCSLIRKKISKLLQGQIIERFVESVHNGWGQTVWKWMYRLHESLSAMFKIFVEIVIRNGLEVSKSGFVVQPWVVPHRPKEDVEEGGTIDGSEPQHGKDVAAEE